MINENWKVVVGYEGLYEVSDLGRVRSLNYNKTGVIQVMKHKVNKLGYQSVHLSKEGKAKTLYVHRLVAQAFIPNPDNLPEVNHKDENPSNNRVENIEWCDRTYNNNYGSRNEKAAESLCIPIIQYSKDGTIVALYNGVNDAERQTGVGHSNITKCCKYIRKTAGGYIWRYV